VVFVSIVKQLVLRGRLEINFTNILRATFLIENVIHIFSEFTMRVCVFWQREVGKTAARKMLMKLTLQNLPNLGPML